MLEPEGYADDCDTAENPHHGRPCRHGEPRCNKPDDVQQKGTGPAAVLHFLSEGEKAERRKLEALKSYRNPYDGNAPEAAGQNPAKAADKPAHKEPEDVA